MFIFTKQHAYILREFLQFLPRFSTWNPINEPGRLSTNLLPLLTMLRCYGSQRFKNQLDKPSLMYCVTWLSKIFPLFIWPVSLCVIHNLIFQRKLSRRRLPITSVYFVSHASAQALRPITFTQRFRTTRHLFSIQLLWKPKILNVGDKRTKFERSKGDLGQFSESCKWSLTRAWLSKHMDLRCF